MYILSLSSFDQYFYPLWRQIAQAKKTIKARFEEKNVCVCVKLHEHVNKIVGDFKR